MTINSNAPINEVSEVSEGRRGGGVGGGSNSNFSPHGILIIFKLIIYLYPLCSYLFFFEFIHNERLY